MENFNYHGSIKNLDAILYENSSVYITKTHSFEILNCENEKKINFGEILKSLTINKATIKIMSRYIIFYYLK